MIRQNNVQRGFAAMWLVFIIVIAGIALIGWQVTNHYHRVPPAIVKLAANCQTPELNLSIGPSNGTAGTIYVDAVFTNQGLRTCTLSGYPTISLVDSHNAVLGIMATHNTAFPVTTVTLHPGESAHAAMGFPEPGNFPNPSVCSAASVNLKAVPPSVFTYLETPLVRQSCPGFTVTAIQPGL